VAPRAGDDPGSFDRGLADLIIEAIEAGVERIVLPSVPTTRVDDRVQPMKAKRDMETRWSTARSRAGCSGCRRSSDAFAP
jgi:hypothetical protein